MLMLLFQAGDRPYALDSQLVAEVLPWVSLHSLPQAHDAIAGLLNYHGQLVTVLDLGQLLHHQPSQPNFGSRIMLIRAESANISGLVPSAWLGLLADRVVDTLRIQPDQLESVHGPTEQLACLGDAIVRDRQVIRCFLPDRIQLSSAVG
jgi:chemotaxis-related protein WspB